MNKFASTSIAVLIIGSIGTGAAFGYEALTPAAAEPQIISDIAALEPSDRTPGMPEVDEIAEPVAPAPERITEPTISDEEPVSSKQDETEVDASTSKPSTTEKPASTTTTNRPTTSAPATGSTTATTPAPAPSRVPSGSATERPLTAQPAPYEPPAAPTPSQPAAPAPAAPKPPAAPSAPVAPAPAPSAPATPAPAPSPSAPAAPKLDFSVTGAPRIGGTVKPGSNIFAFATDKISPANGVVSWQWFRNGSAIAGATSHKYAVTSADIGKTLTARMYVKLSGYNTYIANTPATITVPPTEQTQIHKIINEQRASAGLRSVTRHSTLDALAQKWACHMAENGYGHSTNAWRQANLPAGWRMNGENIAAGYTTVSEVTTGWINSPDHRANILRSNFTHVGVGYCYNANDPYKFYWVQLFAQY